MVVEKSIKKPVLSNYFRNKKPSDVRLGSLKFAKREDNVELVNCAIGNVTLPMYPKMMERLVNMGQVGYGFSDGVVKYEITTGHPETIAAFKNVLTQQGFETEDLYVQVTDGASMAMQVAMLGICGEPGVDNQPLLMFDPTYTNYNSIGERLG